MRKIFLLCLIFLNCEYLYDRDCCDEKGAFREVDSGFQECVAADWRNPECDYIWKLNTSYISIDLGWSEDETDEDSEDL